jgi:hypothetical protein
MVCLLEAAAIGCFAAGLAGCRFYSNFPDFRVTPLAAKALSLAEGSPHSTTKLNGRQQQFKAG